LRGGGGGFLLYSTRGNYRKLEITFYLFFLGNKKPFYTKKTIVSHDIHKQ